MLDLTSVEIEVRLPRKEIILIKFHENMLDVKNNPFCPK